MRRKKADINNIPLLIGLVLLALFLTECGQETAPTSTPTSSKMVATILSVETGGKLATVGQVATDFRWKGEDGQEKLLSQLKGQPVILNWWATWCEPCRKEMPLLEQTARTKAGLNVIGLNLKESQTEVLDFANRYNISFKLILDKDATLSAPYRVRGLPQTVFIDKNGIIQAIVTGQLTEQLVNEKLPLIIT